MVHHKPPQGGFMCSREDMRRWADKEKGAVVKMEVEANEFAALMLMPPPLWRRAMAQYRDPDLGQIVELARQFGVSKEAAARSFAQYHDEALAIIVAHNGVIDRIYRKPVGFPELSVRPGQAVPRGSAFFSQPKQLGAASPILETRPEYWLQSTWGKTLPSTYEQVLFQQNGFALIMVWIEAEPEEELDPDEDRTSKQRLLDRLSKLHVPRRR
jgi:transposase-like protein